MFFTAWLPLQHRIVFRISALVWRCLLGLAPAYLRDLCHLTLGTRGSSSIRSMERGYSLSLLPVHCTSTRQTPASSVPGPSVWNGLPLALRLLPRVHYDAFNSCLKIALFSRAGVGSASE